MAAIIFRAHVCVIRPKSIDPRSGLDRAWVREIGWPPSATQIRRRGATPSANGPASLLPSLKARQIIATI